MITSRGKESIALVVRPTDAESRAFCTRSSEAVSSADEAAIDRQVSPKTWDSNRKRQTFIEEKNLRITDDSSSDGDTLLLSSREKDSSLSDHTVVAERKGSDESVTVGLLRCFDDSDLLLLRRVVLESSTDESHGDVVGDGVGEESGFLRNESNLRSKPSKIYLGNFVAVESNIPADWVVESFDECDDGRLTGPGRANELQRRSSVIERCNERKRPRADSSVLSLLEGRREVVQDLDGRSRRVNEVDPLEGDGSVERSRLKASSRRRVDGRDSVDLVKDRIGGCDCEGSSLNVGGNLRERECSDKYGD